MNLFEVKHLNISFLTERGEVKAVRDISFEIRENECIALVGESGCGKSVTARALIGLTEITGGLVSDESEIIFQNENILKYNKKQWDAYRGNKAAMIFQDSMTALNPTMRIGKQIAECYRFHGKISRKEAMLHAEQMLELVGIPNPREAAKRYPHEFSGGMRQRVMIASALALNPQLLIADEPTTALDVTIQAQILELIKDLKKSSSVMLITHDLGVVAGLAERVVVMYAGKIMETGTTEEIFYQGRHPYTIGLKNASPRLDQDKKERLSSINGVPPKLIEPEPGCPFAKRCEYAMKQCREKMPEMKELSGTHYVWCHKLMEETYGTGIN